MTIDNYLRRIKMLLKECPKPNIFDIKDHLIEKPQSGLSSGTIANYIKAFRSFFGYLYTQNFYDVDCYCLRLPKINYRERCVPTDDDIKKLFQVFETSEDKVILSLLVDCGIRVTELASIKLRNIRLDDASILINGKGDKDRIVYLSETTVGYLREFVSNVKGEYLFPSTRSDALEEYLRRSHFENRLSKLCNKAGIEHVTPHQIRHYFTSHTLLNGADIKAVSQMLGHADFGITLKIYHHVNAKSIREIHRQFSPLANMNTYTGLSLLEKI